MSFGNLTTKTWWYFSYVIYGNKGLAEAGANIVTCTGPDFHLSDVTRLLSAKYKQPVIITFFEQTTYREYLEFHKLIDELSGPSKKAQLLSLVKNESTNPVSTS